MIRKSLTPKRELTAAVRKIARRLQVAQRKLEGSGAGWDVVEDLAACRDALNQLSADVLDRQIKDEVLSAASGRDPRKRKTAADALLDSMRSFLK